ncbi:MAG TPA: DUF4384 domain-containing protein [Candidatus Fraserbacteria bacterium]|nr:DUF4384 domain-containing protein [Candidatus Fraserbacteria bacterium]
MKFARLALSLGLLLSISLLFTAIAAELPVPQGIIVSPPVGEHNQLSLSLWTDQERYYPGRPLLIRFKLNKPAYVYIYDIAADGQVRLIYPNGYSRQNHLQAGEHRLPDSQSYSLVVGGPLGREYLQAIALLRPIPLLKLSGQGGFAKTAFPILGQSLSALKVRVTKLISISVKPGEWAAAWTGFRVVSPQAMLVIRSQPAGAAVYIGDKLRGQTPLMLSLQPGTLRVRISKEGYQSWVKTVQLKAQAQGRLEVQLQPAIPTGPGPRETGSSTGTDLLTIGDLLQGWALNFGLNPASGVGSLGLNLKLSDWLALGGSLAFTGQTVPDYFDLGHPASFARQRVYNLGPELEADLWLQLPLSGNLALLLGGGLATQQQVHLAAPGGVQVVKAESVTLKPNGYRRTRTYLTLAGSLLVRAGSASLQLGYHSRRGWLVGFGWHF